MTILDRTESDKIHNQTFDSIMTLKSFQFLFLIGITLCGNRSAPASEKQLRIATRDDVADSAYVELGLPYQAVGQIVIGNRRCTGTLVRSTDGTHKILTAAHCFDRDFDNQPDVPASSIKFQMGATLEGLSINVTSISIQAWNAAGGKDMAVLTLEPIAAEDCPVPMTVSTASPLNAEVLLIGYGTHGTGLPPFENLADNIRRAATNMADKVFDLGENEGQIHIDFDHPRDPEFNTLGESQPTALEGTSGIGDSGAPLIADGYVAGVLHGGLNPTRFEFSEYGDVSIFAGTFHEANASFLAANNVLLIDNGNAEVAINVDSIAQPGQPFIASSSGVAAKDGSILHVGSFPEGFEPLGVDLTTIAKKWLPFGKIEIRTLAGQPGRFSGSCTGDSSIFIGKRVYWWIVETDTGSPAADLSNVTTWGLFSSDARNWLFPSPGAPPTNTTLLSSSDANWSVHAGSIGTDQLILQNVLQLDYQTWASRVFPEGLPDNLRAPSTDLDDDGLSNLIEWIFGSSPLLPEFSPPFQVAHSPGQTTIQYQRSKFLPEQSHSFEISTTLSEWRPVATKIVSVISTSETTELAVIEIHDSEAISESAYFRLIVAP
ncbi:MAG: hypothetical protein ACI9R3_004558 [Verrucomicrobiales bacterium]|jgi:hypothetical protein